MAAPPTCLPEVVLIVEDEVSTGERFHQLNRMLTSEFDKMHRQLITVAKENNELKLLVRSDAQIGNECMVDLSIDPRPDSQSSGTASPQELSEHSLVNPCLASANEDNSETNEDSYENARNTCAANTALNSGGPLGMPVALARSETLEIAKAHPGNDIRHSVSRNDLKSFKCTIKSHLNVKPKYDVTLKYYTTGVIQKVAKSGWFEYVTFTMIIGNAFWIGLETDLNDAEILVEAHPVFIVFEQFFCFFFTWELAVRFLAFEYKMDSMHDAWFVFDCLLVLFMVLETWVLTLVILSIGPGATADLGGASILRLARLLRLCRLLRVARLLRSMPELFILIKAIMAASRATFFTLCLLTVVLYVYAVLFTQMLKGTYSGDKYFETVDKSMMSLFLSVALTDNIVQMAHDVATEGALALLALVSAVLVATITVMNILIGVLVEAISAVAEKERMSMHIQIVKSVLTRIFELDLHCSADSLVSAEDIFKVVQSRDAVVALDELGIDVVALVEMSDHIFQGKHHDGEDDVLTFEEFMDVLIQLRGSNKATVKDIVELKKFTAKVLTSVEKLREQAYETRSQLKQIQEAGTRLPASSCCQPFGSVESIKQAAQQDSDVWLAVLSQTNASANASCTPQPEGDPPNHFPL